jgi:hypothetical protein
MLIMSEENLGEVEREIRGRVGQGGIDERWKEETLRVERFVTPVFFFFCSIVSLLYSVGFVNVQLMHRWQIPAEYCSKGCWSVC